MITIITIYSLIVVPFILVFKDVYEYCPGAVPADSEGKYLCAADKLKRNNTLYKIELIIDIIYLLEIILNMLKKTRAHKDIESIA